MNDCSAKIDKGTDATQESIPPQKNKISATIQTKCAEISSNMAHNSYCVVQCYQDPGARYDDKFTSLTTAIVDEVVPSHQDYHHGL